MGSVWLLLSIRRFLNGKVCDLKSLFHLDTFNFVKSLVTFIANDKPNNTKRIQTEQKIYHNPRVEMNFWSIFIIADVFQGILLGLQNLPCPHKSIHFTFTQFREEIPVDQV